MKSKVIAMLVASCLVPLAIPSPATATEAEPELPTPGRLSARVAAACGDRLTWERDALGDAVGLAWRAEYARCALDTVEKEGILAPIGERCRSSDSNERGACVADTLQATGLGPQFAALIEACAVLDHVDPGACSYRALIDPLGLEVPALSAGGECSIGIIDTQSPADPQSNGTDDGGETVPPPCDPVEMVVRALCYQGVCLDDVIGVKHARTNFPVGEVCGGAKASIEAAAEAGGWVLNLGVFVLWKVKARASVTVSVSWEVTCDGTATIEGLAWGGFMRQLVITRGIEEGRMCKYDGIIRWDCGDVDGEQWAENVVATFEGAYDHEANEGQKPPATTTFATASGGMWRNEFQGSLQAVQLLERASAVVSGSQDYAVEYADDGGALAALHQAVQAATAGAANMTTTPLSNGP